MAYSNKKKDLSFKIDRKKKEENNNLRLIPQLDRLHPLPLLYRMSPRVYTDNPARNVDIYIPIANLDASNSIKNQVTQIKKPPENVDRLVINKLSTIASQLNLGGNDPTEQLSNLLGWVETKLNEAEKTEQETTSDNKQIALTGAIESLTEQVKRASDIIENNINKSNLLPIQEIPSNQKVIPEQLDPDTASDPDTLAQKNSAGEKLDPLDLNFTIEALNTSIALKQSAISKEKKKKSKADTDTIALWQQEIRSIERSISYLKKKDKRL